MTKPTETQGGVHYIPRNRDEALDDVMTKPDCGNGSPVYLMFAVQDSGRGLTDSEKDILFRRFSQASPRTHVQYGGSGLGLFISRELTERQGGQIGVSSVAGKGSTFAFFVKGRQAEGAGTTSEASAATAIVTQRSEDTVMRGTGATPTRPRKHTLTEMNAVDIPVLIVEDNLVNRRVLKKQLTRLGFPILEAGHGVEALEILRASKYWSSNAGTGTEIAVIACDWEMPYVLTKALQYDFYLTLHQNNGWNYLYQGSPSPGERGCNYCTYSDHCRHGKCSTRAD
jgi:CheY-like chemotaxis protein